MDSFLDSLEDRLEGKQTVAVLDNLWGDGGKGGWIDYLLSNNDFSKVVRFGGGNNAGHTIKVGNSVIISHMVPSIPFNPKAKGIIANGCVVDLENLFSELDTLKEKGIDLTGRIYLSGSAHITADYHRVKDGRDTKIGTTGRGIGPTYSDKAARTGVRVNDLFDLDRLKRENKGFYAYLLASDLIKRISEIHAITADTHKMITDSLKEGKKILFEGAQGALLDIDHGTYPFLTSSNPTSGGIATGTGIPVNRIDLVLGIVKAYATRVGEGPMPTEYRGEKADRLREIANEYGATTGRPRRVGAFDAVAVKYASSLNSEDILITKLDCLDTFPELQICTSYTYKGQSIRYDGRWVSSGTNITDFPREPRILDQCTPQFETMPGWNQPISDVRSYDRLPDNARKYVERIAELTGTRICGISVGPEREQKIVR